MNETGYSSATARAEFTLSVLEDQQRGLMADINNIKERLRRVADQLVGGQEAPKLTSGTAPTPAVAGLLPRLNGQSLALQAEVGIIKQLLAQIERTVTSEVGPMPDARY